MGMYEGCRDAETTFVGQLSVLVEIGKQRYEPLLRRHPEWLYLDEMMEDRLLRRGIRLAEHDRSHGSIRDRIRQRFLAPTR